MTCLLSLFLFFGFLSDEPSPKQKSAEITQRFAHEFKQTYMFKEGECFGTFLGNTISSSHSCLFIGLQRLTLPEAQKMAQTCVKGLYDCLKNNPEDEDCKPENLITALSVRMNFWDQEYERVLNPYIAEIQAYSGKIFYYRADPKTDELILVHEEKYDFISI